MTISPSDVRWLLTEYHALAREAGRASASRLNKLAEEEKYIDDRLRAGGIQGGLAEALKMEKTNADSIA